MELLKPRAIRLGDCVGIVSTSSPVSEAELERLIGYLHGCGYAVKLADGLLDRVGYLAGSPSRRAFSNPTALINSVLAAAGLVTVHGVSGVQFFRPDMAEPWTDEAFWGMVSGPIAGHELPGDDWHVHRDGRARAVAGPVIGGNLRSLRQLVGTAWMPPLAGAILLIEEMTATFDEIDEQLTHLRLAGVFDGIAALAVGTPADWPREDAPDADVDELILRCVPEGFPVITNVGFGHQPRKIQFPLGCRVEFRLGGERPVLRYLEDFVTA